MKKKWFLFLVVLAWGMAWANGDGNETFALNNGQIRISIDHFYQRHGLTPVVLSLGILEINGVMDETGQVYSESEEAHRGITPPLFSVDVAGQKVTLGRETSQAIIYEQNSVRTRLRLVRQDIPFLLALDMEKKKGELRFGESRLPLTFRSEEKSLGVFQIRLLSPAIMLMTTLLYLPSIGTIHELDVPGSNMDPAVYPLWARRLH